MIVEVEEQISVDIPNIEAFLYHPLNPYRIALGRMEKEFGFINNAVYYRLENPESRSVTMSIKRTKPEEWK